MRVTRLQRIATPKSWPLATMFRVVCRTRSDESAANAGVPVLRYHVESGKPRREFGPLLRSDIVRYRLYMQHVGGATPPADYARSGTAVFRPARASKASRRAAPVPARRGVEAARFRLYRQILSPRMTCRARPQRRSAKGKCRIVARTDWTQPRDLCTFRAAYRP